MKVKEWKREVLKGYPEYSQMVPATSMAARGCHKVGREVLGQHRGPKGGLYIVFGPTTHAQRYTQRVLMLW